MIFWPRETATLLKSNLRYFHREKSTFEKFDAGLKLRIVFYTHKTIKTRRKNFRVIYTLRTVAPIANAHIFCALRVRPARSRNSCLCSGAKNFRCIDLLFLYFASVVGLLTRKRGT